MKITKNYFDNLTGDFLGGTSAMLVALPSTIAYGLMCFAPLGPKYSSMAAIGAILGTIPLCLLAPFFGGIKILVSAPTAATAAVISVYVAELVKSGIVPIDAIPIYVTMLGLFAGTLQIIIGKFGGGKFIKYIPYPVITGYLSGLSVLVLIGQLPKLLGLPKGLDLATGIFTLNYWKWESITIGLVTILFMALARKYVKKFPAVIIGLVAGIIAYWLTALVDPALRSLSNNPYVLGELSTSASAIVAHVSHRWSLFSLINMEALKTILVPGMTIMLLLSINTLNTCIILDAITYSHHNPKKELMLQGLGNIAAGLFCGIPAAGILTSSSENSKSGGKTSKSVIFFGINSLIVLLLFGKFVAWIPLPALAGILILVAISLIDFTIFSMLKHKSTVFDFIVILTVVVAAAKLDLIRAAGVGITMAILLFLKEQMGASVIRRKIFGDQMSSKKIRMLHERDVLEDKGKQTIIIQLHGQLFFGTTDQLFSKLEPHFADCRFIVLDMHRIQSVDYTAANMLKKILVRIAEKDNYLIFSSIPEILSTGQHPKKYLQDFGLLQHPNVKVFDDLDATLTWIEDKILTDEQVQRFEDNKVLALAELDFFKGFSASVLNTVKTCIVEKKYQAGELIFRSGDESDEIYFVRHGNIKIVLPLNDGKQFHLQTICMGGIFGEGAFIGTVTRSADALSVDESSLYVLSREKFNEVTSLHPQVAGIFFERLALIIANRLRQANKELKVFQEN
jgi:SulP family sulfate permease